MTTLRACSLAVVAVCAVLVGCGDPSSPLAAPDAAAGVDASITVDAATPPPDAGPWVNPGCTAPLNVVAEGLELALELDLTAWESREYTVHERVTVHPTAAGEAITLFGTALLLGDASHGYAYDGVRATFCTGPFAAGDAVTIEVDYVVSESFQHFPAGNVAGIHVWQDRGGPPVVGAFSSPFFASTWALVPQTMPWFDPDHAGNVVANRTELAVVTPDPSWTVIGPGNATRDGATWRFAIDRAMPVYTIGLAASPDYELVELAPTASGVALSFGVLPGSRGSASSHLAAAGRAIDWLETELGAFPWDEPLTAAEIPGFGGGMEHTCGIWIGSPVIGPGSEGDYVTVHEAIHHWWGNDVSVDGWSHFWLDEGLTDWTTVFAALESVGGDPAMNAALQRSYRTRAAESSYPAVSGRPLPGPLRFPDGGDFGAQVSNNLLFFYRYGAVFLEMIDQRLRRAGTDLMPILRAWFTRSTGTAVTTEQFRDFLIARAPAAADWGALFTEWVFEGPCPTIEARGFAYADGVARVELARTGGAHQNLPTLELAFIADGTPHRAVVALPNGTDSVVATVPMPTAPTSLVIDPSGLYVLRLHTEPAWSGPPVSNVLP